MLIFQTCCAFDTEANSQIFLCSNEHNILCSKHKIPPHQKKKRGKKKGGGKKSCSLCKIKAYVVHLLVTKKGKQVNIYT